MVLTYDYTLEGSWKYSPMLDPPYDYMVALRLYITFQELFSPWYRHGTPGMLNIMMSSLIPCYPIGIIPLVASLPHFFPFGHFFGAFPKFTKPFEGTNP